MPIRPTTISPLRRLARPAAALVAAGTALTLGGCGAGGGDENADPARIAPQGSVIYFTGTVRPQGDQKQAVDEIFRKVFRASDPGKRIQQELDKAFKDSPQTASVTYADDVEPWLGRRAGVAITRLGSGDQTQFAVIVAAKDTGKAQESVQAAAQSASPKWSKRSYKDLDYWFDPSDSTGQAVVDGYLVIGREPAFRAVVDASKAKGLAEKPEYKEVAGGSEDKLAFGYFDVESVLAGLSASGQLPPGQGQTLQGLIGSGAKPVTLTLDARPDGVTLETVARGVKQTAAGRQGSALVPMLPGDSWLAFGAPQVGAQLRRATTQLTGGVGEGVLSAIEQQLTVQTGLDLDRDLLPALGDVAIFARGSSVFSAGAGLVVQTPDPAAARRLVDKLQPLVARQGAGGGIRVSAADVGGAQGFKVTSPQIPGAINVVTGRGRLVVAYGDAATRDAFATGDRLSQSPDYRAAQESLDGAQPTLFVSWAPVAQLIGVSSDPQAQKARTYLGALRTLALGSEVNGDTQTGRFVLTLR